MAFVHTIGNIRYSFDSLRELLAKATPLRSGDVLSDVAARSAEGRVTAQFALADVPLAHFLVESVIPCEHDEVTRLIVDTHDDEAFAPVASLTPGELRGWLLPNEATPARLTVLATGITPEMAAAVSRPRLSSPDSLGAYITWKPRPGRADAERNCISNIRVEGLGHREAVDQLMDCLTTARQRQLTGTALFSEPPRLPGAQDNGANK
jgi:hypothetical protein